jgi:hypothetical protein
VSPEHLQEILQMCEAHEADDKGFRDLPAKTTLTLYLAKDSVGLTVPGVESVLIHGHQLRVRTQKGDLYVLSVEDVFAVNIEGRARPSERRAGFTAG